MTAGKCGVCGHSIEFELTRLHREVPVCEACMCTPRFCGLALALGRVIYGTADYVPLRHQKVQNSIRIIGISDDERLASILREKYDYTNTYYHSTPLLDICSAESYAAYSSDVIICSDVIEHTLDPPIVPLSNLFTMLRPGGFLILSAPTFDLGATIEWYGGAKTIEIKKEGDNQLVRWINRRETSYLDPNPVFHGGPGHVLEMRIISHSELVALGRGLGFVATTVEFLPKWGYSWPMVRHLPYIDACCDSRIIIFQRRSEAALQNASTAGEAGHGATIFNVPRGSHAEGPMVSYEDVRAAYRLILGRDPENENVVATLAATCSSLNELRDVFLNSAEYQTVSNVSRASAPHIPQTLKPLSWEKSLVDTDASPDQLSAMVQHIEATWRRLGESEPYWSVVTAEKFRSNSIEQNSLDFYQGGKDFKLILARTAERCGIDLDRYKSCFELGCGLGRLTVWISQMFEEIIAADISQPHLDIALKALERFDRSNVQLVHLNSFARVHSLPEFDVFVSVIVLQHNPPPLIAMLLETILEKLRPGGIAFFQVPTYWKGYSFDLESYLRNMGSADAMEMHAIPQRCLFDVFDRTGCRLLELREDGWTGNDAIISNSILVSKSVSR